MLDKIASQDPKAAKYNWVESYVSQTLFRQSGPEVEFEGLQLLAFPLIPLSSLPHLQEGRRSITPPEKQEYDVSKFRYDK